MADPGSSSSEFKLEKRYAPESPEHWDASAFEIWIPPAWWIVNGNIKSFEDREKIKFAYAISDDCVICRDLRQLEGNMDFHLASLIPSAEDGCAGCLLLCSILQACASIKKLRIMNSRASLHMVFKCRMSASEMLLFDSVEDYFEVYTLPSMFNFARYGFMQTDHRRSDP